MRKEVASEVFFLFVHLHEYSTIPVILKKKLTEQKICAIKKHQTVRFKKNEVIYPSLVNKTPHVWIREQINAVKMQII